jgi:anhydro-N-acetylmuramic acid kinase
MEALYLGLMSGTSLDGVDAVACRWQDGRPVVVGHHYVAFDPATREELLALNRPDASGQGGGELHRAAQAAMQVAERYAQCVNALLARLEPGTGAVRAIGAHGQTVRHQPRPQGLGPSSLPGYSVQLLNAALLAERTGIDVIADFRSRDLAAGGQGAPLAPAFHLAAFARPGACRGVLNIGGFSNLTLLDCRVDPARVLGWDCGPGNVLMDEWAHRHLGRPLDQDGAWAAQGRVNDPLLLALLADPYFDAPPPKSTGRDAFHAQWLQARLQQQTAAVAPVDVQATLCEFSARCIADQVHRHANAVDEVVVCGGGAHNSELMRRVRVLLDGVRVVDSGTLGLPPTHVEACAFAWLARQHDLRLPGNLPSVTGAAGPRVLGARYPA